MGNKPLLTLAQKSTRLVVCVYLVYVISWPSLFSITRYLPGLINLRYELAFSYWDTRERCHMPFVFPRPPCRGATEKFKWITDDHVMTH